MLIFCIFRGFYALFGAKIPYKTKIKRKSARTGCLKFKIERLSFLLTDLDKVQHFTFPQRDLNQKTPTKKTKNFLWVLFFIGGVQTFGQVYVYKYDKIVYNNSRQKTTRQGYDL